MRLQATQYLQEVASDGTQSGVQLKAIVEAASFNSAPMFVGRALGYVVVASCPATGVPVGTWKLQGSVDEARIETDKPDDGITNWFDLDFLDSTGTVFTTAAVSSATTVAFQETACFYRWVRLVWTRTSGSLTLTAKIQFKGVG